MTDSADRDEAPRPSWGLRLVRLAFAAALVALGARMSFPVPGSPVPQSAQTLAVALVGTWLGARDGGLALLLYLGLGAVGLPVFADGASGLRHLAGPTAGYLAGFVVAAVVVGYASDRGALRHFWVGALVMVGAHALMLGLGWARLALTLGAGTSFEQGVAPFLSGGLAKGVVAAGLAKLSGVEGRPGPVPGSGSGAQAEPSPPS